MSNTSIPSLDLNNIQGDVVLGLPKKRETFLFFRINEKSPKSSNFQARLPAIIPLITSTTDVVRDHQRIRDEKDRAKRANEKPRLLEIDGFNLAFTSKGINQLNLDGAFNDPIFQNGMNTPDERKVLGDGEWQPEYEQDIHGVLIVTGHNDASVHAKLQEVVNKLGDSIIEVPGTRANGKVRPEAVEAHEHFGYADGIAQPLVLGFPETVQPGKQIVNQGIIFIGRKKYENPSGSNSVPEWAQDGSLLAFRKLKQLVPEFNNYLETNKLKTTDTTPPNKELGRLCAGAELLGARLFGRWKDGTPIELSPHNNDVSIASDPHKVDDFVYNESIGQINCPFAAHTRKTNPRDDLDGIPPDSPNRLENRRIIRNGIQYGDEVTEKENQEKRSSTDPRLERGLLFVSYQSRIDNGFRFIQQSWANNPQFIFGKDVDPGLDAIIGVSPDGPEAPRFFNDTKIPEQARHLPQIWVVPRGGEYFITPSIHALKTSFVKKNLPS